MARLATSAVRPRAERLIAAARVALAAVSLAALWVDPSEPARHAGIALVLLASYLAAALAIGLTIWLTPLPVRRFALITHLFDLGVFGCVISFTQGSSSPFFLLLVFAMVNAALRWHWAGILSTGGAALAILLFSALLTGLSSSGLGFEVNRLIIRAGNLVVIAILLGYLGDHAKKLREEVSVASAMEERVRLALDLHDGVIQSLTGASLRLRALPELIARDPKAAVESVRRVEELLHEEQRDLRVYMEEVSEELPEIDSATLSARLESVVESVERHWGLRVRWVCEIGDREPPRRLTNELCSLAREALVNAARHGRASNARLAITANGGHLKLWVADDGRGFPFRGHFDAAELQERSCGPKSLMRRVARLNGGLSLDSSDGGATIDLDIPLERQRS